MKVQFQFDSNSVPGAVKAQILASNGKLGPLDTGLYKYAFEAIQFFHAWQLMGTSPQRFGNDLSQYLIGAYDFLLRAPKTEYVQLDFGNADFKRRVSEDMGASIACLFMVDSFGLEWETITHIPANQGLDNLRPDFEGFVGNGRYVFEAKGLTSLGNLTKTMNKAVEQAKSYPEVAVRKLALVTYLCSDCRQFKSHTFLLDPQLPANVLPDEETARRLHFIAILDFVGLSETRKAYVKYLRGILAQEAAERANTLSKRHPARVEREKIAFLSKFAEERRNLLTFDFDGKSFAGRDLAITKDGQALKITLGLYSEVFRQIADGESPAPLHNQVTHIEDGGGVSVFSDGTLFRMQVAPAE